MIEDNDVGVKSATIDNSFEISLLVSLHALSSARIRLPSMEVYILPLRSIKFSLTKFFMLPECGTTL